MNKEETIKKLTACTMSVKDYYKVSDRHEMLTPENLGEFMDYPLAWRKSAGSVTRASQSPSIKIGIAAHAFVLDNERFEREYSFELGPLNPKTGQPYGSETKAYKEWEAVKVAAGETPVSLEYSVMFVKFKDMFDSAPTVNAGTRLNNVVLMNTGDPRMAGIACLVDCICVREDGSVVVTDLKTTSDMSEFADNAVKLRYREQLATIREMIRSILGNYVGVSLNIAAVEKSAIPRLVTWHLNESTASMYADHIDKYAFCRSEDKWDNGYDEVVML